MLRSCCVQLGIGNNSPFRPLEQVRVGVRRPKQALQSWSWNRSLVWSTMALNLNRFFEEGIVEDLISEPLIHRGRSPAVRPIIHGRTHMMARPRMIQGFRRRDAAPSERVRGWSRLKKIAGKNVFVVVKRDRRDRDICVCQGLADNSRRCHFRLTVFPFTLAAFLRIRRSLFPSPLALCSSSWIILLRCALPSRLLLESHIQNTDISTSCQ